VTSLRELETLQLASLLHDIGKFYQRTGLPPKGYEGFSEDDHGPHGAHAKWSAAFVSEYVPPEWREGLAPVLYHHQPKDTLSKLIAVADWLSAGEREKGEEVTLSRLRSIFDSIKIPQEKHEIPTPEKEYYYPLQHLDLEDGAIFPLSIERTATQEDYEALWKEFVADVQRVSNTDFTAYFETLYHVLQKYTWSVPSAYYKAVPDVSLFDHSRSACAIAVCLRMDATDEVELDRLLAQDSDAWAEPRFLLVGGDVSGVQDFIYTLTSKGAAKGLRGRSVYLQLLSEVVARWLLRHLELSIANLLYCGGGHFYLLAPLEAGKKLEGLKGEISQRLLSIHLGDLYLALAEVPLTAIDFQLGKLSEKWHQVTERLTEAKCLRFRELKADRMQESVFEPQGEGGEPEICAICQNKGELTEEEGVKKCSLCRSFEDLGRKVAEATWLVEVILEEGLSVEGVKAWTWEDALRAFGTRVELVRRYEEAETEGAHRMTAYRLNDANFLVEPRDEVIRAYGFRFLAQVVPYLWGEKGERQGIATFTDLAECSQGFKRLGVLRMDVDNLGLIFSKGLGEKATISRISTLSFLLQVFFRGWLNKACEGNGFEDRLYVTYSGGDDLFIVGSWDAMPELAWKIRSDFQKFTCNNRNVTISGGIALVPAKYPLYKAADIARVALEEQAKGVQRLIEVEDQQVRTVKDAVSFLGKPVGWEEFEKAKYFKDLLVMMLRPDAGRAMPRALLTRLRTIYDLYAKNERARAKTLLDSKIELVQYVRRILYDKWRWRLVYGMDKLARGYDEYKESLKQVQKMIVEEDDQVIGYLDLPVRWVEFLTRERR